MTKQPTKNPIAVALGKLAKGHPKNYSADERKRRSERLKAVTTARFNQRRTERLKAARRHQEGT